MDGKKKIAVILGVIIAAVLIVGGFFIYKKYRKAEAPTQETPQTLGEQIYKQVQNPAEKIPETNPYAANTNPFETAKTNPFKDTYKNPFGE